jgi:SPX domain protein involved in polyphosphate accumulation
MKFGEYFRMYLTPEWSSQYIPYKDMKDMLNDIMSKAPTINENISRQQYFLLADEEFLEVRNDSSNSLNLFILVL